MECCFDLGQPLEHEGQVAGIGLGIGVGEAEANQHRQAEAVGDGHRLVPRAGLKRARCDCCIQ